MKGILLSSLVSAALTGGWLLHNPHVVHVEIEKPQAELRALVQRIAHDEKIPPALVKAVIDVESSWDESNSATKFEPHVAKVEGREGGTSYGAMQVMGYHAKKTCGLSSWAELVGRANLENNVRCGVKVLANCVAWAAKKQGTDDPIAVYDAALGCYNGDRETYPRKVWVALGKRALASG